jgi:hypothetical protein
MLGVWGGGRALALVGECAGGGSGGGARRGGGAPPSGSPARPARRRGVSSSSSSSSGGWSRSRSLGGWSDSFSDLSQGDALERAGSLLGLALQLFSYLGLGARRRRAPRAPFSLSKGSGRAYAAVRPAHRGARAAAAAASRACPTARPAPPPVLLPQATSGCCRPTASASTRCCLCRASRRCGAQLGVPALAQLTPRQRRLWHRLRRAAGSACSCCLMQRPCPTTPLSHPSPPSDGCVLLFLTPGDAGRAVRPKGEGRRAGADLETARLALANPAAAVLAAPAAAASTAAAAGCWSAGPSAALGGPRRVLCLHPSADTASPLPRPPAYPPSAPPPAPPAARPLHP